MNDLFRAFAADEQLTRSSLELKRNGWGQWRILIFLPSEDAADAYSRIQEVAKMGRAKIELKSGWVEVTFANSL
jgi:hypothetical protein